MAAYGGIWGKAVLRNLSSALARLATSLEPNADPMALERKTRSAITDASKHIGAVVEGF